VANNPYRDTLATIHNAYGTRDTYDATPPVPAIPNQHHMSEAVRETELEDMMERYGHDSMYPATQGVQQQQYQQYHGPPPIPHQHMQQQMYEGQRDTYFPPASANANAYGGSSLKQRLEAEEAKLAAQQRDLAESERDMDDSMMPNNMAEEDPSFGQKTSGVVVSRSHMSKLPQKSAKPTTPTHPNAPVRDWLGGAGAFNPNNGGGGSPNYI